VSSAVGGQIGVYAQVAAVALGVGAVVERSAALFTVIKLAGAAYLVVLGVQAVRHRRSLGAALHAEVERKTTGVLLRDGFVVGVSNPKAIVFFAAVLPQFVDLGAGGATGQMLVLGLLFALIAATLDSTWGLAAGAVRAWFATSPARLRLVGGTGGLTMVGLGIGLAFTGRPD
jgi:threonine/homoserine/homoserine lactone efflux protein